MALLSKLDTLYFCTNRIQTSSCRWEHKLSNLFAQFIGREQSRGLLFNYLVFRVS